MSTYSDPTEVRRSTRTRSLTFRAAEQYQETLEKHYANLSEMKHDLDNCVEEIDKSKGHRWTLESLDKFLTSCVSAYLKGSDILCDFLKKTRTVESERELIHFESVKETILAKADIARSKIRDFLEQLSIDGADNKSSTSHGSRRSHSTRTSASSILKRKEAKLEAQRAAMRHLDEELALVTKLKQARARRELDVITSEVNALKEVPDMQNLRNLVPSVSSEQRTKDYVENLNKLPSQPAVDSARNMFEQHSTPGSYVVPNVKSHPNHSLAESLLDPMAQPFAPKDPSTQQTQLVDTFTKHLVKRDLIMSRLSKYDDDPMMFPTWKISFLGIMSEVDASPTEELELLCQNLGPESSKQAKIIKACNANNPNLAIFKIFDRLEKRFGAPELIEKHLREKIKKFPDISVDKYYLLYDLLDLASEIVSIKAQPEFRILFSYFDSKLGVNELAEKLPWNLKEKWISEATKYKQQHSVMYPPFSIFVKFLENMADMKNDPAFQFEKKGNLRMQGCQNGRQLVQQRRNIDKGFMQTVSAKKTETVTSSNTSSFCLCPLHKNGKHTLNDCVPFRRMSVGERKKVILTNGICFKCCSGKKHRAKNCRADVKCSICQAVSHPTALHENIESPEQSIPTQLGVQHESARIHEGETTPTTVVSTCTKIPGSSKSCAKIVPVRIFHESNPDKVMMSYATIDDQSNQTLATSSLFDYFEVRSADVPYTLVSCSGSVAAAGRISAGYVVQSLDGSCELSIPQLIECNDLPKNTDEIPSPEIALQYPHLQCVSSLISSVMENVGMDLLIGRDITRAHIVQDQLVGEGDQPFAQKLPLGWVIVRQVCLGGAHVPEVKALKTFVFSNGRHSNFQPCDSEISVYRDLFRKTEHDEKLGLSVEDQEFLQIMDTSFCKDAEGHWVAPLPFKKNRPILPNNRPQALRRARSLDVSLHRDPKKLEHVKEFMQKLFDKQHAEIAPDLPDNLERWYLPMFGIYHPKNQNPFVWYLIHQLVMKGLLSTMYSLRVRI